MKKIFVIAIASLIALSANAQSGRTVIGHVNFNELVMLMPEMDEARATLHAAQQEAEETYASMVEEYQTKITQYQQKSSSWTAAIKEAKEKEIMDMQNRIQDFQQSLTQELQQQQSQLMAPINEKATKVVKEIAKVKGIEVLFDDSQAIYFDYSRVIDITEEARNALNIKPGRTMESLQAELAAAAQAQQAKK